MLRKNGYNFTPRKLSPMLYLIRDCKHKWYVLDDVTPKEDMMIQTNDGCRSVIVATFSHTNEVILFLKESVGSPILPGAHLVTITELCYLNELIGRATVYEILDDMGWTRDEVDDRICELNGCVRPFGNIPKLDRNK